MTGIFQLRVGCHVWPNTIKYAADYSKHNELVQVYMVTAGEVIMICLRTVKYLFLDVYMRPRSLRG